MPSTDILLNSSSPLVTILLNTTGSNQATTAMVSGIVILGVSGNMGTVSSVSRLTWAWARDGGKSKYSMLISNDRHYTSCICPLLTACRFRLYTGLPKCFGYVDAKRRVPSRAVLLVTVIVVLLSLLNIGSGSYIALSAIVSLSSLAIYLSYAIVFSVVLYARLQDRIEFGVWNFGKAGVYINIFALVYTLYAMIWLPFPNYLPVTASNMNYCGPVFGVILIGAVTLWFVRGRHGWDGPNRDIIAFVLRNEE